jgi:hypothetical protein
LFTAPCRNVYSAGSDGEAAGEDYDEGHSYHASSQQVQRHPQGNTPHRYAHQEQYDPYHGHVSQQKVAQHYHSQSQLHHSQSALGAPVPSAAPTLAYRVRGGPGQQAQNSLAANSVSSLGSSGGGWVVPEEEAAAAEAALKAELKQAKVRRCLNRIPPVNERGRRIYCNFMSCGAEKVEEAAEDGRVAAHKRGKTTCRVGGRGKQTFTRILESLA